MAYVQCSTLRKLPENFSRLNGQTIMVSATGGHTSTTAASYFNGMHEQMQAMQLQVQILNSAIEDQRRKDLASVSQSKRFEKQIKELKTRDAASSRQIQELNQKDAASSLRIQKLEYETQELNQKDAASSLQIQKLEHETQELKQEGEADRRMLIYSVEQDIPLLATKFIEKANSCKRDYPRLSEEADALAILHHYRPKRNERAHKVSPVNLELLKSAVRRLKMFSEEAQQSLLFMKKVAVEIFKVVFLSN